MGLPTVLLLITFDGSFHKPLLTDGWGSLPDFYKFSGDKIIIIFRAYVLELLLVWLGKLKLRIV